MCDCSNHLYSYYVYGEILLSNVKLPLLNTTVLYGVNNIRLNVRFGDVGDKNYILKLDYKYIVSFANTAIYYVYENEDRIDCTATDNESLFSTIFNIPFSIYFLMRNELLIHCCSMIIYDRCLCFAGNKGVGKSTLVSLLCDDEFIIFGDDTLRVKKDSTVYRAHNLIKITDETANKISANYEVTSFRNLTGKVYGILPNILDAYQFDTIIELLRINSAIAIRGINSIIVKNNIIKKNIVGVSYFDKYLFNKLQSVTLEMDANCFVLTLPDGLQKLIAEKNALKRVLKERCIYG